MFRISDTHYAATWLLDSRAPAVQSPGERGISWSLRFFWMCGI